MKILKLSLIAALVFCFTSCRTPKKVPYVVEAEGIPVEVLSKLETMSDPVIAPGDLLNIDITATDMAAIAPFVKICTLTSTAS